MGQSVIIQPTCMPKQPQECTGIFSFSNDDDSDVLSQNLLVLTVSIFNNEYAMHKRHYSRIPHLRGRWGACRVMIGCPFCHSG